MTDRTEKICIEEADNTYETVCRNLLHKDHLTFSSTLVKLAALQELNESLLEAAFSTPCNGILFENYISGSKDTEAHAANNALSWINRYYSITQGYITIANEILNAAIDSLDNFRINVCDVIADKNTCAEKIISEALDI